MKWLGRLVALSAAMLVNAPAFAGPRDGTLTVALSSPIEAVDIYMGPGPETALTTSGVFNPLVVYDTRAKAYVGVIAESWAQIDPETMEFKIKPGLTFQDGSALDANDVAYTINFISNPDVKFRLKSRFAQFAGAEAVDDLTVRVHSHGPFPMLLARLIGMSIYPSDLHSALGADYASWGRAPVGSGPYKVVSYSDSTGIVLERWDGYQLGPLPEIERIVFKFVPDAQTQVAEMMVGGVDLLFARSPDQVTALSSLPNITSSMVEDMYFQYIYLDAAGRSGIEAFKDKRVRQAAFIAIDRNAIRNNIVPGGADTDEMLTLCYPFQVGCPEGDGMPGYDPEKARALLAEAGYADGFDLKVSSWGSSVPIAEAVTGYLRAVGIRASVDVLTIESYRKKQVEGGLQALVSNYPYGGLPDSGADLDFFFGSADRDYLRNARVTALTKQVNTTLDAAERNALFKEAFDAVAAEYFILPISKYPAVIVHSSEVSVDASSRGDVLFAQLSAFESYGDTPPIIGWAN